MLNIYTKREFIPDGVRVINDVEAAFRGIKLIDNEFTRIALREVEQAEFIDESTFKDRFNRNLYIECLSTGTKCLMCIQKYVDRVINICELGQNGRALLSLLQEGSIFVDDIDFELYKYQDEDKLSVCVNGVSYDCYDEINDAIGGFV